MLLVVRSHPISANEYSQTKLQLNNNNNNNLFSLVYMSQLISHCHMLLDGFIIRYKCGTSRGLACLFVVVTLLTNDKSDLS